MRIGMTTARAMLVSIGLCAWAGQAVAQERTAEVVPGVTVTRKTFPVPANEAPFFGFADKTAAQKAADEALISGALARVPDRSSAAQMATAAGWQALIAGGDFATAGKRFNQAYLLDPHESGSYHGFRAVAASRLKDFDFADELFRVAARMNNPARTLSADHGRVLLMANRPAQAKPLLEKAILDNPDWAVPRANLAWASLQLGDAKAACRLAGEATGRDAASIAGDMEALKRQARCPLRSA
ncbi:MAG TPA: hypothetical protein VKA39_06070 [Beijerinckiaceae bacterium]|nr:hypothetical protein [Beijerinckiaceae bacterium]